MTTAIITAHNITDQQYALIEQVVKCERLIAKTQDDLKTTKNSLDKQRLEMVIKATQTLLTAANSKLDTTANLPYDTLLAVKKDIENQLTKRSPLQVITNFLKPRQVQRTGSDSLLQKDGADDKLVAGSRKSL